MFGYGLSNLQENSYFFDMKNWVLNNITKFFTAGKLKLAIISLLLALGVVSEQTKPVLSKQIHREYTSNLFPEANNGESGKVPLAYRLREIRGQRNLIQRIKASSENRNNAQTTQVSNSNTANSPTQHRTRFVSSAQLLRNISTPPQPTAAVTSSSPATKANFPTKDGTYLYGQSPQPNQIGQGYVLFEKRKNRITGALYMPESEFSCFQGSIESSGELAMTVASSPGEVGVNQLATGNQLQIPNYNDDQMISYPYSVELQNYYQLTSIGQSDRRILEMCKQVYSDVN
jgi:hypothetical protein